MFQIKCKHSKIYKLFKWNHHWSLKTEKIIESFLQITSLSIYWSLKTQTISWIDAVRLKVCVARFTRSLVLRFLSQNHLKPQMLVYVGPCFFHFGVQNPSLPFSDLSSPGDLLTFWPQKTDRVQRSVVAKLRLGRVKNLDLWWSREWSRGNVENVLNISRINITC